MRSIVVISFLAGALAVTGARADTGVTYSALVEGLGGQGSPNGCRLSFEGLHRDPDYFADAQVLVGGSLVVTEPVDGTATVALTLGVAGLDGPLAGQFQAPTGAWLLDGGEISKTAGLQALAIEPGHGLFVFQLDASGRRALAASHGGGTLRFAYAMGGGTRGSPVAIGINVIRMNDGKPVVDDSAVGRWAACLAKLTLGETR